MRKLSILAFLVVSACMPTSGADVSMNRTQATTSTSGMPVMKSFGATQVQRPSQSNGELAQSFLALEFHMESGRPLPYFSRFEGPITVALAGEVPKAASAELAKVIQRFRNEAGIDVSPSAGNASITIEFIPRGQIQANYNNVACFVAPRVSSWAEFRAAKGTGTLDWATLTLREKAAIFVPSDTSPQEVRDCLHEELAQAMGPLNDLYQLPDSVFNDDNFHTVLTGFDMLMLRMHYAPELRSGMTQAEVAGRLPAMLVRLNPGGQGAPGFADAGTPRAWINAMETALGPRGSASARQAAAQQALTIAMAQGWHDNRLAFSYFAIGRINLGKDPATARAAFDAAGRIYRAMPGGQIHAAHVDMQLAALALTQNDPATAVTLADRAIPVVRAGENAALLSTLMMVKSEAFGMMGRDQEAEALRLDSLGWARYGFGADQVVRARMSDISALVPAGSRG